jgi:SAM-dependent methyltransferase
MNTPASAFDSAAESYDAQFTHTEIGAAMRRAVWRRCAAHFKSGMRILEMNCGTGEDANWLADRGVDVLATDSSAAMLRVARDKTSQRRATGSVRLQQLRWEGLGSLEEGDFDGALSNFGGLNCVEDMTATARGLAQKLRPGAVAILCIMGPVVPWEWAWYLLQGEPSKAFRRMRRGGTAWSGITIHYPSIREVRQCFAPLFRTRRVTAIGALMPPPYTETRFARYPRLLGSLDRLERKLEACWPLPQLADHYLLELERL